MPTIGSMLADTSGADIGVAIGTCVMAAFTCVAAVAAGVAAKRAGSAAQATQTGVAETKRLVDLEAERRVEERRERGTANVGAELQRISNRKMLKIWNNGPAIATDITVTCDRPDFMADPTEAPRVLRVGQPAQMTMALNWFDAIPQVTIRWVDLTGPQHLDVSKVPVT